MISKQHWYPWEGQTEKVVFWPLIQQFAMYWIWVVVWYFFSYVGNDPIHIKEPIIVNNQSAEQ